MPRDVQLEDILLPAGSVSLGYFWENRPYNVYHWIDENRVTRALYFNIADSTQIHADRIEWRDLTIDLLISADGRCRVLDEDELPDDIDSELLGYIQSARDELCRDPLSRLDEYDKLTRSLMQRE